MGFIKDKTLDNNFKNKIEFKKSQTEKELTLEEKGNTIRAKENYHTQGLKQAKIGFYSNEEIENCRNCSDFVYFVCDHWNACAICTYEIGKPN